MAGEIYINLMEDNTLILVLYNLTGLREVFGLQVTHKPSGSS